VKWSELLLLLVDPHDYFANYFFPHQEDTIAKKSTIPLNIENLALTPSPPRFNFRRCFISKWIFILVFMISK